MNGTSFKSAAYAAKKRLIESGYDVGSGHIHEIIAALCGYRSNAGFLAETSQHPIPAGAIPVVVSLDMERATDRAKELLSGIGGRKAPRPGDEKEQKNAAYSVARIVSECLELVSTSRLIFLRPMGMSCENRALKDHASAIVLADPVMAGVVDDPKIRYRDAISEGWSEGIAEMVAEHLAPLTFPFGSSGVVDGRLQIRLSDEYSTAGEEFGLVHVYMEGTSFGRNTYTIDSVRIEFVEGDYFPDGSEFDTWSPED